MSLRMYLAPHAAWRRPRARLAVAELLAFGVLSLVAAPSALADTNTSSNWSGYVAHKSGTSFRYVTGTWRQPSAVCTAGDPTYSAAWVGLGGYSTTATALEQLGTELDCNGSGQAVSSAWYELVPAPANGIKITVKPGDLMSASVRVIGHKVTLDLTDKTRHKSFSKTTTVSSLDVSSADWIVEAPSACLNDDLCRTLQLTDFGSVRFADASAQTTSGRRGSISSRLWGTTEITLAAEGRMYIDYGFAAGSTPSPLQDAGTAFAVDYSQSAISQPEPPYFTKVESTARSGTAVQPGGRRR